MEKYDIIIQAGQSNSEGNGRGPVDVEFVPMENVLHLDVEKQVESNENAVIVTYPDKPFKLGIAKERVFGKDIVADFSLTFAKKYVDSGMLEDGRKLIIIRAAIGSTGFVRGNWGMGKPLFDKMLEMTDYAMGLSDDTRLVGFLWHQGETDAFRGFKPEDYRIEIEKMVNSVRERYGVPNLPFVAGDFVHHWKNEHLDVCEPIINKTKEACANLGNSAFVKSDGLLSNHQSHGNGDIIHFCRQSLYELGERYFDAYYSIIND